MAESNQKLTEDQQYSAHRWFAVECNNLCWDLTTATRTPQQDARMLHAAHAAAFHWGCVGEAVHHMRADQLLAHVHALLGMGDTALRYALSCRQYFATNETPDWELAFTHAILAQAAAVAGDASLHASTYAEARSAMDAIADPEDRAIVEATFVLIPEP